MPKRLESVRPPKDPDSFPGLIWRFSTHPASLLSLIAMIGALAVFNVLDCHGFLGRDPFHRVHGSIEGSAEAKGH